MPVVDVRFDLSARSSPALVQDKVTSGPSPREVCVICGKIVSNQMALSLMGLDGPLAFSLSFAHKACSLSDVLPVALSSVEDLGEVEYFWYTTANGVYPALAWHTLPVEEMEYTNHHYAAVDVVARTLLFRGMVPLRMGFSFTHLAGWDFYYTDRWSLFFEGRLVAVFPPPPAAWLAAAGEQGQVVLAASSNFSFDEKHPFQHEFASYLEDAHAVGGVLPFFSGEAPNLKPWVRNVSFFTNGTMPELVLELGSLQRVTEQFNGQPGAKAVAENLGIPCIDAQSPENIPWQYTVSRVSFTLLSPKGVVLEVPLELLPVSFRALLGESLMVFLTDSLVQSTLEVALTSCAAYGGLASPGMSATSSVMSKAKNIFRRK